MALWPFDFLMLYNIVLWAVALMLSEQFVTLFTFNMSLIVVMSCPGVLICGSIVFDLVNPQKEQHPGGRSFSQVLEFRVGTHSWCRSSTS